MSLNSYNSKMILITSRGMVHTSRGIFRAPTRTPYREYLERIWSIITEDRADVYEVLKDGTKVKLTPQNFDQDNSSKKKNTEIVEPDNKRPMDIVVQSTQPTNSGKKKKHKGQNTNNVNGPLETPKTETFKIEQSEPVLKNAPELPATPLTEGIKEETATQNPDEIDDETLEAMTAPDNLEVTPEEV